MAPASGNSATAARRWAGADLRAIIRSRMRVGMDRYQHQFKDADVLLFEPAQDDEAMFFANLFSYRDRCPPMSMPTSARAPICTSAATSWRRC